MTTTYDPFSAILPRFLRGEGGQRVASRNERDVLRLIWNTPGITRSALTAPLDLTQQSLHRIVEQLHQRGIIRLSKEGEARSPGARSPALSPNRDWCLTIGVAVNVGSIALALMGFGEPLAIREIEPPGDDLDTDLRRICEGVSGLLNNRPDAAGHVLGVGLGISGYRCGEGHFNAPLPLTHWSLVDLAPMLSERLALPVWADNSTNTAALAEVIFGLGRECRDFAYIAHNYGYGGALITGGRLFPGSRGNAGELSGLFGTEDSMRRPALHLLLEHLRSCGRPKLTLQEMATQVSPDWPGVMGWINEVTPAHNRAVNALSAVFDPELIVLGGELPPSLANMLIERTEFYSRPRHGISRPTPRLTPARVTTAPSAIGAALMPLFETVL